MDIILILIVILIIVLVLRGPAMLPRLGQAFGRTVKDVRENVPGAIKGDPSEPSEPSEQADKADKVDG